MTGRDNIDDAAATVAQLRAALQAAADREAALVAALERALPMLPTYHASALVVREALSAHRSGVPKADESRFAVVSHAPDCKCGRASCQAFAEPPATSAEGRVTPKKRFGHAILRTPAADDERVRQLLRRGPLSFRAIETNPPAGLSRAAARQAAQRLLDAGECQLDNELRLALTAPSADGELRALAERVLDLDAKANRAAPGDCTLETLNCADECRRAAPELARALLSRLDAPSGDAAYRAKVAARIVDAVINELEHRGGLDNAWHEIDSDIRVEIRDAWIAETVAALADHPEADAAEVKRG